MDVPRKVIRGRVYSPRRVAESRPSRSRLFFNYKFNFLVVHQSLTKNPNVIVTLFLLVSSSFL
jgi:hypothetical protein